MFLKTISTSVKLNIVNNGCAYVGQVLPDVSKHACCKRWRKCSCVQLYPCSRKWWFDSKLKPWFIWFDVFNQLSMRFTPIATLTPRSNTLSFQRTFSLLPIGSLVIGRRNMDCQPITGKVMSDALYFPCFLEGTCLLIDSFNFRVLYQGQIRAENNGRSTDNVRSNWRLDRSNVWLAGHVDRSKLNIIK